MIAALALAGCAEAEKPVALPAATSTASTTSAAPSQSVSASPTATRSPGEFDEATKRSAEQFVRDFWDALTLVSQGEQDVDTLTRYYAPSCEVCRSFYQDIKKVRDKNQRVKGGKHDVLSSRFDTNTGRVAIVDTVVRSRPGDLVDANTGRVVHTYSGSGEVRYVFNLVRTGKGWYIQDVLHLGASG